MLLFRILLIIFPVFVLSQDLNIIFNNYNPRALVEQFPGYGKTWMYFPDGNGIPQIAQLNVSNVAMKSYSSNHVHFHLYTKLNPNKSQQIYPEDKERLTMSNYDPTKPTKFVVHGWTSSYRSPTLQVIKNNYLQSDDYNIILVNWENIAETFMYPIAAMETKNIGDYVAKMIDFLVENGGNLDDMHIIGHSLGAHVSGNAGHAVRSGKVGRITGLDPALPGFELVAPNEKKLDSTDAQFVDVIHTCGGILGYYTKLGHADFYPNGGVPSQPGCFGLPQLIEGCSHGRSWQYFAESIKYKNSFLSIECDSWDKYKNGHCANNTMLQMGATTPKTARGVYYLITDNKPPFAREIDFRKIFNQTAAKFQPLGKFVPILG